jgi:hypothetical protein
MKTPTTTLFRQAENSTKPLVDLPALEHDAPNSAAVKAPKNRSAVGLRPSLDSDAYFDAPSQDQEAPKQAKNKRSRGLDRPRSFTNELRKRSLSVSLHTSSCAIPDAQSVPPARSRAPALIRYALRRNAHGRRAVDAQEKCYDPWDSAPKTRRRRLRFRH